MKILEKIYLLILITLCCYACNDPYEDSTYQIYDMNPVSTYLESRTDDFSEWIDILKYADLFNAVNQASSYFTVFVPTNAAIQDFYNKKGVQSIQELGVEYARSLAEYHIINDSINLNEFIKGGKLEKKTLSDDYLSVTPDEDSEEGGFNSLQVNKEAHVKELAIQVSNGYIYVLDAVLSPLVENVYQRISYAENQEKGKKYKIFNEILNLTSWNDSLIIIYDVIEQENGSKIKYKRDYTVLAVSDDTYKKTGILSVSDLISKIKVEDTDYTSKTNELYRYVAYHIIEGNYEIFDFKSFNGNITKKLWNTKAGAVLEASIQDNGKIYFNYSGKIDDELIQATFIEENSDIQAKNGVLHEIDSYLPLWESKIPIQVEWDFCDYPEVASYIKNYGTEGQTYQQETEKTEYRTEITNLSCYIVDKKSSATPYKDYNPVDYFTVKQSSAWTNCKYKDQLILNIGYTGSITMQSPIIIEGKYKITLKVCYATSMNFMRTQTSGSNGGSIKFILDNDETTAKQIPIYANVSSNTLGIYDVLLYEEYDFKKTEPHNLKMIVMDPSASTNAKFRIQLDYLLFEPILEEE